MAERKPLSPDILVSGTSIRLLALETTKSKWTTTIIGARPGKYIIVEMPRVAGAPIRLDDGARWAANFISKGAVYSFNTTVLGYTYRLVPLLFLEYPREVEIANLRTEQRYPVNIPVISKVVGGLTPKEREADDLGPAEESRADEGGPEEPPVPDLSEPLKALAVDISESGFLMASPVDMVPDMLLESTFYLPGHEPLENVKAVVRASRGKAGGFLIGLAFNQNNSPEVMGRLSGLIRDIEKMPLRF